MGMTYMDSMPDSVIDHIVEGCTGQNDGFAFEPIMVSNLDDVTYFVAVERRRADGEIDGVQAVVYKIRIDPDEPDGWVFGWRAFDEAEGPLQYGCPPAITDLLTPTKNGFASEWRSENAKFNRTREGRECVRDAVVTDLRVVADHVSPRP